MNRLTIFLLAGVTVLLSGVAGRRSFESAAARAQSSADLRATGASAPAASPTAAAAPLVASTAPEATVMHQKAAHTAKISPAAASTRHIVSGETPDDYVYVKPASANGRRAGAPRDESRAVPATTSVKLVFSPARTATSAAAHNYERSVAEAEALAADDLTRAARRLEFIAFQTPARPEAFEKLAAIRLQLSDFYQAYEMYASAIRNGGKASFAVMHDHARGSFDSKQNDTCAGNLSIQPDKLTFEGTEHRFAVSWAELLEAGSNRLFGSRIGGFHVKVGDARKSRNFNLAPRSKDKREANIILDLLIENAEGK